MAQAGQCHSACATMCMRIGICTCTPLQEPSSLPESAPSPQAPTTAHISDTLTHKHWRHATAWPSLNPKSQSWLTDQLDADRLTDSVLN